MTFSEFVNSLSSDTKLAYNVEFKRAINIISKQMRSAGHNNNQVAVVHGKFMKRFQENAMSGKSPVESANDALLSVGYF